MLQPCSTQPSILWKKRSFNVRPSCSALQSTLFSLKLHPCNFIKKGLQHRDLPTWVLCGSSFKNFFWKNRRSPIYRLWLLKIRCLTKKYIELAFNSKDDLYCVKGYIYLRMSMPMPMPIPRCRYRGFQMAFSGAREIPLQKISTKCIESIHPAVV